VEESGGAAVIAVALPDGLEVVDWFVDADGFALLPHAATTTSAASKQATPAGRPL
jgi:hypothetical protein